MVFASEKNLGKVRHLATADLWIQDKLKTKDFALEKVLGADNPADLLTKYLDATTQDKHIGRLNLVSEDGRAISAPSLPKGDGG